uniref:Reverse transcriptase domain-containing protein n=1 Tax=Plectus sambesii TaxID=2011161 RepID=A0A914X2I6_9BILA
MSLSYCTLTVPLAPPHGCALCMPVPRKYSDHNGLAKHLKQHHPGHTLNFACCKCGLTFADLKKAKAHIKANTVCAAAADICATVETGPASPLRRIPFGPRRRGRAADIIDTVHDDVVDAVDVNDDVECVPMLPQSPPGPSRAVDCHPWPSTSSDCQHSLPALATQVEVELIAVSAGQSRWVMSFASVSTVEDFEAKLNEFIAEKSETADTVRSASAQQSQRTTLAPSAPRPSVQTDIPTAAASNRQRGRSVPEYDAASASKIQKLYRLNRAKAFRAITAQSSPFCSIDKARLCQHFSQVSGTVGDTEAALPEEVPLFPPVQGDNDPLSGPLTTTEVWAKLRKCPNTAPGPDGIRYNTWRRKDLGGHMLTAIFNAAHRLKYVPRQWLKSTTILLHKKGDRDDVTNWRPIALSNTIGKIYSSVMAARLTQWMIANNRISPAQKGFMPYEGCLEHNFVLQTCIQDARRSGRPGTVAWLDLKNAFGSVPHSTILRCMQWTGLSADSIEVVQRLYDGCVTNVRTMDGLTDDIPILSGVKQGCPLSPIVFNIAIEPIIRAVQRLQRGYLLHGVKHDVLAYADDLVLISGSVAGLQRMLDTTSRVATWAGLTFNPLKCASLHVDGKKRRAPRTRFSIQHGTMLALGIDDFYEHLGVPTGFTTHQSALEMLKRMKEEVRQVDGSLLAPWQKFDAVNTFVLPRLSFHLKCGSVPKTPLNELDKQVKAVGKKWLCLPQRASAEILYMSYKSGGQNLLPTGLLADISQLVHAMRLFTSKDASIQQLALSTLVAVVRKRVRREVRAGDVSAYLNGSMEGDLRLETTDVSSMWTRLRSATRRLRTKLAVEWRDSGAGVELVLDNVTLVRSQAESRLRSAVRERYLRHLIAKPDQGKVIEVTAATSASNHFMRTGSFTRFAEWRFIHRARLGVVPLNGCRRFGSGDTRCRRCGASNETLPHVLNHCRPHFSTMVRRHDAILDRLEKALHKSPATVVRRNMQVPGCDGSLRPDLVVTNEVDMTATIVDVTVPFENRREAFVAARAEKKRKYAEIARHYQALGYKTFLDAFVVGTLGGYDSANAAVLVRLGISRYYAVLMKRLMVTDTVRWSRDIYTEHVTGHRQY